MSLHRDPLAWTQKNIPDFDPGQSMKLSEHLKENDPVAIFKKDFAEAQQQNYKDNQRLSRVEFSNYAQKAALDSFAANPTDRDAFEAAYKQRISEYDIPLADRVNYMEVAGNAQRQYYTQIFYNQQNATKAKLKYNAAEAAQSFADSNFRLQNGTVNEPFNAIAAQRNIAGMRAALGSKSADGTPLFTEEEMEAAFDDYALKTLTTQIDSDLSNGAPIEALQRMADPDFDYSVTFGDGEDAITISEKNLSPANRNRFDAHTEQAIEQYLEKQAQAESMELGMGLFSGAVVWDPSSNSKNGVQKSGLDTLADLQILDVPISRDTMPQHMQNCLTYAQKFGYIPTAYRRTIKAMTESMDPEAAAHGAQLMNAVTENGAFNQFDKDSQLRGALIYNQLIAGTNPRDAVAAASALMAPMNRTERETMQLKLADLTRGEDGKKLFYGDKYTDKSIGYTGARQYRELVDSCFLLTRGNRDAAIKMADNWVTANFSKSTVGLRGSNAPLGSSELMNSKVVKAATWPYRFVRSLGGFSSSDEIFYHCPEAVYRDKTIGKRINSDLEKNYKKEVERKSGMKFDVNQIILTPDPRTEAEIGSGGQVSWVMQTRMPDGTFQYFFDRSTGRPMRYTVTQNRREK